MELILQAIKALLNKVNIQFRELANLAVPANWEAPEGEPGHVLNRTHYFIPSNKLILPETAGISANASESETEWIIEPYFELKEGYDYIVNFNGSEYQSTAVEIPSGLLGQGLMLGNLSLGYHGGGIDTGEPFIIYVLDGPTPLGVRTLVITGKGLASVTLAITEVGFYKRLNKKFIPPDDLAAEAKEVANNALDRAKGKLDASNPFGTGYIQFNRKSGSIHSPGAYSALFGKDGLVTGEYSFAAGFECEASGEASTAMGRRCKATSDYSVAIGTSSNAENVNSIAIGNGLHINTPNTIGIGKWNDKNDSKEYVFLVGNGSGSSADAENVRSSNAHTLDWEGNAWYSGTLESAGLILTSPNGTKYKITVADDGTLTSTAVT